MRFVATFVACEMVVLHLIRIYRRVWSRSALREFLLLALGLMVGGLAATGIFQTAADAIGCVPATVLMVGDSGKDDAGAAHIGMRTLLLPRTRGPVHGLAVVPALVRATR